ncbi:hypothetical protein BDK51DRAFT_31256, partial [Blyttiomyces helicus]
MSATPAHRSVRSIKSLLTHLHPDSDEDTSFLTTPTGPLARLHLPPSIRHPTQLSPDLWAWLHSDDFTAQDAVDRGGARARAAIGATWICTADGDHFPVPDHVVRAVEDAGEVGKVPVGGRKLVGMTKSGGVADSAMRVSRVARKPLSMAFSPPLPERPKIRRFYLQLTEIRVKASANVPYIVCKIQIGSQKQSSTILTLSKNIVKGFAVATMSEGFLFDTSFNPLPPHLTAPPPTATSTKTTSQSQSAPTPQPPPPPTPDPTNPLPPSPSLDSMASSCMGGSSSSTTTTRGARSPFSILNTLRRSTTAASGLALSALGDAPSEPVLGEVAFSLPTAPFCKVSGSYGLTINGKKEVARVALRMGLFLDDEFEEAVGVAEAAEPDMPPTEFADYLNFMIMGKGPAIWRKYWCIVRGTDLLVLDSEYHE